MALQRGPLLLLTLSLGLASAQKTLEEVPVQPGFNAHKVMELGRVPGSALGHGGRCPVLGVAASGSRTQERKGEGRSGPRISLCPAQAGTGGLSTPAQPWGQEGAQRPPPSPCLTHLPVIHHCEERGWSNPRTQWWFREPLTPPQTRPGCPEPSRRQCLDQMREELKEGGKERQQEEDWGRQKAA